MCVYDSVNILYVLIAVVLSCDYLLSSSAESLGELDVEELIIDSESLYNFILPGFTEIVQYVEPSMELFYTKIFMPKVPAIMKGNISLSIYIFEYVLVISCQF